MAAAMTQIPTIADVLEARERLNGRAIVTPLIESPALNALAKGRVLIKAECLQRTGSFKFRGAWNCISRLSPETSKGGVVAYSSGNHAQGVAAAAQMMKLPALIVMPEDTPEIKKSNTRSYGAEIVTYDRARDDREAIANKIAGERGAVIVPPFDHPQIIAGQGTSGLEAIEQAAERNIRFDAVLIPAGGGGLTAGNTLAFSAKSPGTQIHAVEPEGFDDHARSLKSGKRERNAKNSGSICDALLSPAPGELTFAINQPRLAPGLVVSEAEVKHAMRFAFEHLKIVIEPGGAVGLAAILARKIPTEGRAIAVIASGGNVDPAFFAEVLAKG
jgi:threonine dehydratase